MLLLLEAEVAMAKRCGRRVLGWAWIGAVAAVLLAASSALAHSERPVTSPIRPGSVPALDRTCGETLVVCKATSRPTVAELLELVHQQRDARGDARAELQAKIAAWHRNAELFGACRYEHIQDAVAEAHDGACVQVMPGVYLEEPSRAQPTSSRGDNADGTYSYAWHRLYPNDANLIAIIGKYDITLEGTGAEPREVVVDAGFAKDVVIRADRADGVIIRNLWARDSNEHAIYVVETDGYVFDRTVGSYARDYELFSTASDNGLFTDCEALGGSDSGLYIGQSPDTRAAGRWSAEVRRCKIHHNALGFSGTQGNSVWMHDNEFTDNGIGLSYNTQNDHVNAPQRASLIERNHIHHNNFDVYAEGTDVPVGGPGRSFFHYPVGTGLWIVGGHDNLVRENRIHDNQHFGALLASNPLEGPVAADVHNNAFVDNLIGTAAGPGAGPNSTALPPGTSGYAPGASDFYWDETGNNNCWGPNPGTLRTDRPVLPGPCPAPNTGRGGPPLQKLFLLFACSMGPTPDGRYTTGDSPFVCPWGGPTPIERRNAAERECGNGALDLGEQCDPGLALAESCGSLGHGAGALACSATCTYDTRSCEANSCGRMGPAALRVTGVRPGRASSAQLQLSALDGSGRGFDPSQEGVDVVLRNDAGATYSAVIPAGASGWSQAPSGAWSYLNPGRKQAGVRSLTLGAGAAFGASAQVAGPGLAGLGASEIAGASLRVGDDCWAGELSCDPHLAGPGAKCTRPVGLPGPPVLGTPDSGGGGGPCPYCGS